MLLQSVLLFTPSGLMGIKALGTCWWSANKEKKEKEKREKREKKRIRLALLKVILLTPSL